MGYDGRVPGDASGLSRPASRDVQKAIADKIGG